MKKLFSDKMSKNKLILSVTSLLVMGTGTAFGTYEGTKDAITVSVNGNEETIRTHADTVGDLFADLDIDVRDHDELSHSENTKLDSNMKIVYEAAQPVTLEDNGKEQTVWTTADTVGELLKEEGIKTSRHDEISPSPETKITNQLSLSINRAFQLTMNVGGKEKKVWTTSTTVADFLKEQKITLNSLDKVEPGLDDTLQAKDAVTVKRIEKVTDVVEEPLDFAVVKKNDGNLERGKQEVVEEGKKGSKKNHFEVVKENGKVVSRKLVKEETVKKSADRIVAIGTKEKEAPKAVPAVSKPASAAPKAIASRNDDSASKELYVTSTAYTASCSGCSGRTATGVNLKANPNAKVIAVDPGVIPLGTKVHVEGYGYAVAADTGSAINGNKIDVFFPDQSSAINWGSKRVKIKILD
ncbi:ubiquitin-like domain-containing protein [Metabacillus sp. 84]|uniref:ubiquitin-like domain-containing protein n=1 Tax=unclassified Metabacillus TaxID=2675274 RepID=UPI003CFAB2A7